MCEAKSVELALFFGNILLFSFREELKNIKNLVIIGNGALYVQRVIWFFSNEPSLCFRLSTSGI